GVISLPTVNSPIPNSFDDSTSSDIALNFTLEISLNLRVSPSKSISLTFEGYPPLFPFSPSAQFKCKDEGLARLPDKFPEPPTTSKSYIPGLTSSSSPTTRSSVI